jgi:hypothetical protein
MRIIYCLSTATMVTRNRLNVTLEHARPVTFSVLCNTDSYPADVPVRTINFIVERMAALQETFYLKLFTLTKDFTGTSENMNN